MGHLRDNGFEVTLHEVDDIAALQEEHGSRPLSSGDATRPRSKTTWSKAMFRRICSSASWRRIPGLAGITVPGMVPGPPGMERDEPVPYDVLTFDKDGNSTIYESR